VPSAAASSTSKADQGSSRLARASTSAAASSPTGNAPQSSGLRGGSHTARQLSYVARGVQKNLPPGPSGLPRGPAGAGISSPRPQARREGAGGRRLAARAVAPRERGRRGDQCSTPFDPGQRLDPSIQAIGAGGEHPFFWCRRWSAGAQCRVTTVVGSYPPAPLPNRPRAAQRAAASASAPTSLRGGPRGL
jgi:hypothetical protein